MVRSAALGGVALTGLLLAGCAGGSFGQSGLSLPVADDVQTVSDAADALDAHRTLASENAKAAIAATDALGSFVREISTEQRALARARIHRPSRTIHSVRVYPVQQNGKAILTGAELIARPSGSYCENSAGYAVSGIPSLDETFGWQSGTLGGGTRMTDDRGSATWSANASGAVVQGAIGGLSLERGVPNAGCPMSAPAFVLRGGSAQSAFSLPVSISFRAGQLANLSVVNGKFANGESLEVTTPANRQPVEIDGVIANGRTQVATFRINAIGDGTLTITSTGAQYVIGDWIVVGT